MTDVTVGLTQPKSGRPPEGSGPGVDRPLRRRSLPPSVEVCLIWTVIGLVGAFVLDASMLFLATTAVVMALFAMSVNVLFGWTGVVSFGQAGFFGTGAYAVALMSPKGVGPILAVMIGVMFAAVLAFLFAVLATRVSGVQFAILTLVLGQVLLG